MISDQTEDGHSGRLFDPAAYAPLPFLNDAHRRLLAASAISPEVALARGYTTVTNPAELEGWFPKKQWYAPCLVIPIHDVHGERVLHQIRPDNPPIGYGGKTRKYVTPEGTKLVLDIPPAVRPILGDASRPLLITEGSRKVDAGLTAGLDCIGVIGVWAWKRGGYGFPCWDYIALNGRTIRLCFDSDLMTNPKVKWALRDLKGFLEERGANVVTLYLPAGEDGDKVGLDDFLAAGHTAADVLALVEPPKSDRGTGRTYGAYRPPVRASDVAPEKVDFLWHPYVPVGKVTVITGDPAAGKSYAMLALAAALSKGRTLPGGGKHEPCDILYCTLEDGLADTLRPRLDKLDADLTRIHLQDDVLTLDDDEGLARLERWIQDTGAVLVVLDTLTAYMGGQLDINKANQTRAIMAPLHALASRYGCAIVVIRHAGKAPGRKALHLGLGSVDITAACRSELLAGQNADNPNERALIHVKSSLAATGAAVGYEIDETGFRWTGESNLTAGDLMAPDFGSDARGVGVDDACEFIREQLSGESAVTVQELKDGWAGQGGSYRTLERARARLGVKAVRVGEAGGRGRASYHLKLPDAPPGLTPPHSFGGLNKNGSNNRGHTPIRDYVRQESVADIKNDANRVAPEPYPPAGDPWTCRCGRGGVQDTCVNCGQPRPAGQVAA